jgi:extracellular factor (EF) 3-hydroxypalmitic acid methyl ester biosynthesis protein
MNHALNGHSNGTSGFAGLSKPELTQAQAATTSAGIKTAEVVFQTAETIVLRGLPLRLTRQALVFELYNPIVTPQFSEVLHNLQIRSKNQTSYSGRAVIRSVINVGTKIVCEATLDENAWVESHLNPGLAGKKTIKASFEEFVHDWQQFYRVNSDYKVAITDLQSLMTDLRLWLDRVELGLNAFSPADRNKAEQDLAHGLRDSVLSSLSSLFENFEAVSDRIEEDFLPAHRAFGQRLLHPFLLSSPFLRRTYTKPLGYAGDYEMMNMIVRNGLEGGSLFAKFINAFLLAQAAPQAVRNRVDFLQGKIVSETSRLARQSRTSKIFGVACGPAWEAVNFLASHPLANHAQFQLLDFEDETLRYTTRKIHEVKTRSHCRAKVEFVKNSVQNLLRTRGKAVAPEEGFDLIYCSGLYDYLSDKVCQALNDYLYGLLNPGGLLVVGNFSPHTLHQNIMEHFAEWFLIYRHSEQLAALAPEQAPKENCVVRAEPTGTNIFLEVRKPSCNERC